MKYFIEITNPPSCHTVAITLNKGWSDYLSFDDLYTSLDSEIDSEVVGSSFNSRDTSAPTHSALYYAASTNQRRKSSRETVDSKARYSSFKLKEMDKSEEQGLVCLLIQLVLRGGVADDVSKAAAEFALRVSLLSKHKLVLLLNIPSYVPQAASRFLPVVGIDPTYVPLVCSKKTQHSVPAGSRNRPTSVPAGRPFSAGWKNHAARPMTRPSSHYFQHFSRPGIITKCIWMREDGELLLSPQQVVLGEFKGQICNGDPRAPTNVDPHQSTAKAPTLYDSHNIVKTHVALLVPDTEETLELAKEKQAYWLPISQPVVVKQPVPSEPVLKKEIHCVFDHGLNKEIKEMKAVFNQMETEVAKCSVDKKYFEIEKRELSLDNDCILEHIICQDVMNVVMHANDHHDNVLHVNKNSLVHDNSALDRLKHENDRLMNLLISQDLVHIAVNSVDILDMSKSCVDECNKCLVLETELLKKKYLIEKNVYDKLLKSYSTLEKHCISLELATQLNQEIFQKDNFGENQNAPTFNQLFEINELKAQSQENDTIIRNLKDIIKSMTRKESVEKVKKDIDEIKIINIGLEHSVAKLLFKNENLRKEREHLKSIYKDQFDSIKKTRVRSKEHSDSLIAQINAKSVENSDLNAQLQEKVLAIAALKNKLRKLKGKTVVDNVVSTPIATTIAPDLSCSNKASESKPRSNTKNDKIPQTSHSNKKKNKVEDHPRIAKSSLNNSNHISKSVCNLNVQQSMPNANSQLMSYESYSGTVRFGNDQIAKIMGYGDYQLGNVTISRFYYVKGLGHNLFYVGQFCDSDLEVAFRKHTCFIRNLDGVELIYGSRDTNLYTISLDDMLIFSDLSSIFAKLDD
ncbi:hypothetical protein Tco_0163030 [Tanacetum coccineum]